MGTYRQAMRDYIQARTTERELQDGERVKLALQLALQRLEREHPEALESARRFLRSP